MSGFQPKTPEELARIAKLKRNASMKVLCSHIADAIDCKVSKVYRDSSNGIFNIKDLRSIAYYIVAKTLLDN